MKGSVEVGHISWPLLPKGEGGGILQMGASNLDDIDPGHCLLPHRPNERLHSWDETVSKLQYGCDMHRRNEGVIGGLRHVDIIVGMNGFFAPKSPTNELNCTVGNHLIDVHVRLSA